MADKITQKSPIPSFKSMKVTYDNKQVGVVSDAIVNGFSDVAKTKLTVWTLESFTAMMTRTLTILNTNHSTPLVTDITSETAFVSNYGFSIVAGGGSKITGDTPVYLKIEFSYDTQWGVITVEVLW